MGLICCPLIFLIFQFFLPPPLHFLAEADCKKLRMVQQLAETES